MEKIMAVNAGSSSLKFQILEFPSEEVITEGLFEKIGLDDPMMSIKHYVDGKFIKETIQPDIKNHADAVKVLLDTLLEKHILGSLDELTNLSSFIVTHGQLSPDGKMSVQYKEAAPELVDLSRPCLVKLIKPMNERIFQF